MARPRKQGGPPPSAIGRNLLRLRNLLGITQEQLAEASGVHRVSIGNLERGKTQSAELETLKMLATALNVRVSDLTEEPDYESPIEPVVRAFIESPWGAITKPTEEELAWLRRLPAMLWVGLDPAPEAMHHLVAARRSQRKP